MKQITIPQIKKPSMLYGLGVASSFIDEEKNLQNVIIDGNDEIYDFLKSNDLLEGLKFEEKIIKNANFLKKQIDENESITLTNNSIYLEVNKDSNLSIDLLNSSRKFYSNVIILHIRENVNCKLKIIEESINNNRTRNAILLKVLIENNSILKFNELVISSNESFRRTIINLKGKDTEVYPNHALFAYDNADFDFKSVVKHFGVNSNSDMKVKGIISGNSRVISQGHVTIKPSAFNANGYLQEDLILIGNNSIAQPIPNLEIGNNDVKCSHGATVSNIDDETLFYLQSRGINKDNALSLLLSSFLNPILNLISEDQISLYQSKIRNIIESSKIIEKS